MKVSFIGPSGTGKSYLANHVRERYGLPLCPVGSRSVSAAMGFASPYDVDAAGKRDEFQRRLFVEKLQWEEMHQDGFVTDRTHLDNLAYHALHGGDISDADVLARYEATRDYDVVFYVPLHAGQWLGDDPARKKELGYHRVFDALASGLLNRAIPGRFVTIVHREKADRVGHVNAVLDGFRARRVGHY